MARKQIDARDLQIGQPGVVNMSVTGDAELDKPDILIVDGPKWKSFAEELAFMEEPVEVEVATTSEKHAEKVVEVFVNGRRQNFIRGVPIVVRRKFVERLARAKPEAYENEEFVDAQGNKSVRYPKSVSLRYPFRVVRDDNPKGADWLRKILAEA